MSSIMRARNGLTGRSEVSEVIEALSQAEGCWTLDARDRMPLPSRATAHHLRRKHADHGLRSPPARAGSFNQPKPTSPLFNPAGAQSPVGVDQSAFAPS